MYHVATQKNGEQVMSTISALNNSAPVLQAGEERGRKLIETLRTVLEGVRQGFAAAAEYENLIARGIPHSVAIERVLGRHFVR
jgi:hypothetical protein